MFDSMLYLMLLLLLTLTAALEKAESQCEVLEVSEAFLDGRFLASFECWYERVFAPDDGVAGGVGGHWPLA